LNRRFLLIYCALNAAFALLGLALCGAGFFCTSSFGVRALAWLLSLEAGFLGAFGAVYFSFRAYRNKIEDELRAGKYDEILGQSPKNSAGFISGETSANDTNSASCGGKNRGSIGGGDKISYSEVYGGEILKSESFSDLNLGAKISNARNFKGAVNFTSGETRIENDDSRVMHDETAAENIDKAPVPRTFKLPFGIVYERKKFVENRLCAAYPFKILFVYHSVILARNGLLVQRKKTRCLN